jgi:low affinity Fe/Cu permease
MVFLIQAQQNRDGRAVQLKLDELIRAHKGARNIFADLEDADEAELKRFAQEFKELRKHGVPRDRALGRAAKLKAEVEAGTEPIKRPPG